MVTARKGPPKGTGGRPPKAPEDRRVYRTMRLAPETDAIITNARTPGESYSATIDRLVQGSMQMHAIDIIATWLSESHLLDPDAPRADIRTTAERINNSEQGWTFTTPSEESGWVVRHERYFFSDAELETVIATAEQKSGYR